MLKTKILENTNKSDFENEVNDFIKDKNVKGIQYAPVAHDNDIETITNHQAMIIYESKENDIAIKIGITERGDAGLDTSWYEKIKDKKVDGAILITKNITDDFLARVLNLYSNDYKIIVHCTCTGWGGTIMEPNVPPYKRQLEQLRSLIDAGFPIENCVLRIDPIFPTPNGLQKVGEILSYAESLNLIPKTNAFTSQLSYIRIRISIFDEYKHVKERFKQAGFNPMYGDSFYASKHMMHNAKQFLRTYALDHDIKFETCAEPYLTENLDDEKIFIQRGCVSEHDLKILNLPIDTNLMNMQHRNGCMCLSCKTELLQNKKQCPHKCLYCYWKNTN